jgi:DNA-binding NarL/FixJ family response regulator
VNPDVEKLMPDPDRRDEALLRVLCRVHRTDGQCTSTPRQRSRDDLTDGDRLVLQTLSRGLTVTQASDVLGIPYETVKSRLRKSCRVLRAKNSTHAVANAIRAGLIP